jgi:hypothetical protein
MPTTRLADSENICSPKEINFSTAATPKQELFADIGRVILMLD